MRICTDERERIGVSSDLQASIVARMTTYMSRRRHGGDVDSGRALGSVGSLVLRGSAGGRRRHVVQRGGRRCERLSDRRVREAVRRLLLLLEVLLLLLYVEGLLVVHGLHGRKLLKLRLRVLLLELRLRMLLLKLRLRLLLGLDLVGRVGADGLSGLLARGRSEGVEGDRGGRSIVNIPHRRARWRDARAAGLEVRPVVLLLSVGRKRDRMEPLPLSRLHILLLVLRRTVVVVVHRPAVVFVVVRLLVGVGIVLFVLVLVRLGRLGVQRLAAHERWRHGGRSRRRAAAL